MYTSIFFQLDLVGVFQWHTGGVSQNTATGRYYVHQLKGSSSFWGEFCDPTREMKLKRCVPTAKLFQCPEKEGKNDAEKKKMYISNAFHSYLIDKAMFLSILYCYLRCM